MNHRLLQSILAAGLLLAGPVWAVEVEGVDVPESVEVGGSRLLLNGAGVRTKFFFDIYVGALYLTRRTGKPEEAIGMEGPKRVSMHMLYGEVSREKLVHGWNEGFRKNQSRKAMDNLKQRLERFNAMFSDVKKGDVILLDYLPERGTSVTIRGERKGVVMGKDFNDALLAVWLGRKPADGDLKEAMLGQ